MKVIIVLFVILSCCATFLQASTYTSIVHVQSKSPYGGGFWRKKMQWKSRWVKSWQEKKIYVGVWKRVWGPVEVKEWVPLPSAPLGWSKGH